MKKVIPQGLSKIGSQIMVLTLFIFLISSCSSSNSVVSRKSFSKRKYTSGYFNSKRKIPRSKETCLAKTEFTQVNEIKLQSPKTINSRPIPNMEIAKSEVTISKSISRSEFDSRLGQEKSKLKSNLLSETDITTLPDQTSSYNSSLKEKASNSDQQKKRNSLAEKHHQKKRYGSYTDGIMEVFLISLGAAIIFGILFLVFIETTSLFYLFGSLAVISGSLAIGCLIVYPLLLIMDAIF